ncbi:AAC_HP2_G0041070.mRNA.1.CDS.1 [Saccharomyces cerevisiae]|nr:AAC_HP2_G0041070.mRNA.1.CDS.1 [Saccharomyces cerevisiae]CAI6700177.1 AAC_HP2_G0041070.mRNA.1.CDS.1 [Saccharomyces cerevisiae]
MIKYEYNGNYKLAKVPTGRTKLPNLNKKPKPNITDSQGNYLKKDNTQDEKTEIIVTQESKQTNTPTYVTTEETDEKHGKTTYKGLKNKKETQK